MATRSGQDVATSMMSNCSASSRRRATSLETTGTSPDSNMLTAGRPSPRTTPNGFGASRPVPRAALKKGINPASALDRVDPPKTYASGRVSAPYENFRTPIFGSSTTTARGRMTPSADAPSAATGTRLASGPNTLTAGPQRVKSRPAPPSLLNVQRESESAAGIRIGIRGRVGGGDRGGGRVLVKTTEKALATSVAAAGRASAVAQKASEEVAAARKANNVAGARVVDLASAALSAERQALKTRGQALVSRATEGAAAKGGEESKLTRKVLPLKPATRAAGVEEAKEATLAARPARPALAVRAASRSSKKEVMEARWRAKKAAVAAAAKAAAGVAEEAAAEAAVVALRATAEMTAANKASKAARERVRELTAAARAARREGLGARGQALPSRAAAGKVGQGGEEAGASRKALVAEATAVAGAVAGAAGLAAAQKVNEAARERAGASTTAALVARRKALKATRHALALGAAAGKLSDGGVKASMTPKSLAEGGVARAAAEVKDEGTATREALPLKAAATATGVDKKTGATVVTRPTLALRAASGSPKTEMTAATQEAKEAAAVAATGAAAAASSAAAGVAETRKTNQEARERAVGITAEPLAAGRESQVKHHALASRPAQEKTTDGGGERTVSRKALVAGAVERAATGKHPESNAPREALPLEAVAGVVGVKEEKEEPVATRPTLAFRAASRSSKKKVTTTEETRKAAAGTELAEAAEAGATSAGAEAAALRAAAGMAADANRAVRERVCAIEAEAVAARREAMVARRQMLTSRSAAAMGPPLSAGLPPLPVGGTNHFAIGTAPAREQRGEDIVPPGQHGWVSPHVYLKPSVARVARTGTTEEASVSTVAGGGATGAAEAGVEEEKGEEATRQAEVAMRRAEEAAAACAAAAATATVVVAPPLPAGLPPLPRWGVNNFAIGTAAEKEQRGEDFVPPGQHGWVSPHVYLKPSVARVASAVVTEEASGSTVAGRVATGAAEAGVEEEKGEEATRQAEVAMRRAEEAATAAAAAAASAAAAATAAAAAAVATVVVAPPLPAGLPPLPRWGVNNFAIGTAFEREQRGEDFVPPGQHGWVSPHVYLKPSVARVARAMATEEASVSTAAGRGEGAGVAEAGVAEGKGEEATRQAKAAMRRAVEAAAAVAAAAPAAAAAAAVAAAAAAVAPPLPAGLPPVPDWGLGHFEIGTALGREQREDAALLAPAGTRGWVSTHFYR